MIPSVAHAVAQLSLIYSGYLQAAYAPTEGEPRDACQEADA